MYAPAASLSYVWICVFNQSGLYSSIRETTAWCRNNPSFGHNLRGCYIKWTYSRSTHLHHGLVIEFHLCIVGYEIQCTTFAKVAQVHGRLFTANTERTRHACGFIYMTLTVKCQGVCQFVLGPLRDFLSPIWACYLNHQVIVYIGLIICIARLHSIHF